MYVPVGYCQLSKSLFALVKFRLFHALIDVSELLKVSDLGIPDIGDLLVDKVALSGRTLQDVFFEYLSVWVLKNHKISRIRKFLNILTKQTEVEIPT